MIEGMFGVHNGSWMTNTRDLIDAVRDYDHNLGEVIEEQLYWAESCINECEEFEKEIWELTEKIERFEEENTKLQNDYNDLRLENEKLKKDNEELKEGIEKYKELEEEYEELKSQLDKTSGFHFIFEGE